MTLDSTYILFRFEYEVVCKERQKPRDRRVRPPKDEFTETESVFSIHTGMSRDEHAISTLESKASCFVLTTNVAPKELSDKQALREYKNQSAVE